MMCKVSTHLVDAYEVYGCFGEGFRMEQTAAIKFYVKIIWATNTVVK
jgi:hypothetical protein